MLSVSACSKSGGGLYSPELAGQLLDSPDNYVLTGSAFASTSTTTDYIFADKTGAIAASTNQISETDPDPALPLTQLDANAVFSDEVDSGTCNLGSITSTATNGNGNTIVTSITATGCADQSTIELDFDTSELGDNAGNEGTVAVGETFTVDTAPVSTVAATGNTNADGTGTTNTFSGGNAGIYNTVTTPLDNSVVMTFSKDMTGGDLTPVISNCSVTIASASLIAGTTVVWTLGGLDTVTVGTTVCDFDISAMTDGAGNPVDPSDPNLTSMTLGFQ